MKHRVFLFLTKSVALMKGAFSPLSIYFQDNHSTVLWTFKHCELNSFSSPSTTTQTPVELRLNKSYFRTNLLNFASRRSPLSQCLCNCLDPAKMCFGSSVVGIWIQSGAPGNPIMKAFNFLFPWGRQHFQGGDQTILAKLIKKIFWGAHTLTCWGTVPGWVSSEAVVVHGKYRAGNIGALLPWY